MYSTLSRPALTCASVSPDLWSALSPHKFSFKNGIVSLSFQSTHLPIRGIKFSPFGRNYVKVQAKKVTDTAAFKSSATTAPAADGMPSPQAVGQISVLQLKKTIRKQLKKILKQGVLQQYLKPQESKVERIGSTPEKPLYMSHVEKGWMKGIAGTLIWVVLIGILLMFLLRGGSSEISEFLKDNISQADPSTKHVRLSDVKGCEEAKEELQDVIDFLKNPAKFTNFGVTMNKGILLTGPPGCGKTLLAKAVAGEADVPFYFVSGSQFDEMLVGVGARRIRSLFKKAKETAPCIIFIDEIDAVGSKRTDFHNSNKMTLNQLLVEMDGFSTNDQVVVIGATNLPEALDPALTRAGRFDRKVSVHLPGRKARKEILEHYLDGRGADSVDLDVLAATTAQFSGADLYNMVNTAAGDAVKRNLRKVPMRFLELAKENVRMGPIRKSLAMSEESKRLTAFHEAGHALVALNTPGYGTTYSIEKATILPRGNALGMVAYLPKDEVNETKQALLWRIDTAMGGRAAEEIMFGADNVTTGAASDFSEATRLGRAVVEQLAMNFENGPISFERKEVKDLSPALRDQLEQQVKALLTESYQRAKKILYNNDKNLRNLANALVKHETLTVDEIQLVLQGGDIDSVKAAHLQAEEDLRIKEEELLKIRHSDELLPQGGLPLQREKLKLREKEKPAVSGENE